MLHCGFIGIPLEIVNIPIGLITNCFSPGSVCLLWKRKINSRLNFGPHVESLPVSSHKVNEAVRMSRCWDSVEHMKRWSPEGEVRLTKGTKSSIASTF